MGYSDAPILEGASSQAGENHYRISAFFLATSGIVGLGGLLGKEQKELRVKPDFQNTAWKPRYQKQEWSEMKISIENSRIRREEEERARMGNRVSGGSGRGDSNNGRSMGVDASQAIDRFGRPILPENTLSETELMALLSQYTDWPIYEARMVIVAESGGNANAQSGTNDDGLAQIYRGYWKYGIAIYDPATNINLMHWKWNNNLQSGVAAWTGWNAVKNILW